VSIQPSFHIAYEHPYNQPYFSTLENPLMYSITKTYVFSDEPTIIAADFPPLVFTVTETQCLSVHPTKLTT
jgi:hypothetical protein